MTTMSAVSGAPAPTTLTPPSSSHGNDPSLSFGSESNEPSLRGKQSSIRSQNSRAPLVSQNGNSNNDVAHKTTKVPEQGYLSPPYGESADANGAVGENRSPADSLLDLYGSSKAVPVEGLKPKPLGNKRSMVEMYYAEDPNDPNSLWIHRDKLARIENEELQAAGIFLPRTRASSKPRHRDRSVDHTNNHKHDDERNRSRKESKTAEMKAADVSVPSWDLRRPEEVAEDYFVSSAKTGSRIPVAKTSPLPVAQTHLDRDTRLPRKRENSPNGDSITYQKPRSRSASLKNTTPPQAGAPGPAKRSVTEGSPTKKATATRKPSTAKAPPGRPKTRSGQKDSSGSSTGRPSTRSGDLAAMSGSKPMEGDPPWMVSAYTPDPRLPPDQQLLPTVARRLQQERWEKEGKFGNIYDKEFRPLTEDGFGKGPDEEEKGKEKESAADEEKKLGEWPLKEQQKTPSSPQKPPPLNSYSTMPKIQDKPGMSPLPSPRTPLNQPTTQITTQQIVRMPQLPVEEEKKKGCGCCVVM